MEINVQLENIVESSADLIIVNLFKGVNTPGGATGAVDQALAGQISQLITFGDCSGALGDTCLIYTNESIPTPRVLVVGLGNRESFDLAAVRTASAAAIAAANSVGAKHVASIVHGGGIGGLDIVAAAQAVVEASKLELYRMPRQSSGPGTKKRVESFTLVEFNSASFTAVEQGARAGRVIAESTHLARDLVAHPANVATPTMIADTARTMATEVGLACTVLERADMEALGMGILLAVAKGSDEPPKFVIIEHNKARADELDTIVLVGKGVTFDTGGYTLKILNRGTFWQMKDDMTGAADVIATLRAAALLDIPLHVVGLAPLTENNINGRAQKPGDVFTGMTGKTMEVISTDAEGRMILADALAFAGRYKDAKAVIDLATLTATISLALGPQAAGLFTEDTRLQDRLIDAGDAVGERLWPMPMYDEYADAIKSQFADVKNSTLPDKSAGVATSAKFLQHFTEDYPWAHLDIAGVAWSKHRKPMVPSGATAFGVRLLIHFLRNWSG
ncbi:MAG: leucyl aminopeptidase [Chloroflexi bacterium]|nr:leucyl aminopeptidase [Chloroflexota bacterium]